MKLWAVFLLVSCVVVQASGNQRFGSIHKSVVCPSGWTLIDNRCFLYVAIDMTWAVAERNCLSMGANLALFHSMNEEQQVQNLTTAAAQGSKEAWIGGSDGQQEKIWFWSDGRPMTYTNWCPREPNNLRGNQNCLQMNHSGGKCWDDLECDRKLPSVCVKKL